MTEENQSSAVRKHNNKWRVVDIVVAAIIAVASGVIFWGWDIVCTAPLAHAAVIGALLDHDLPVFTELNLVSDGYRENMAKAAAKKLPLFLSSTMLYRRETQYIKQQVAEFGKPVHYIYHIGQYLPDWHPWENYKNFFVGTPAPAACARSSASTCRGCVDASATWRA